MWYLLVLRGSMHMLWIQSMPSMTQISIVGNGLHMPTNACPMHMPIGTVYFKVRVLSKTLSHIWLRLYLPI